MSWEAMKWKQSHGFQCSYFGIGIFGCVKQLRTVVDYSGIGNVVWKLLALVVTIFRHGMVPQLIASVLVLVLVTVTGSSSKQEVGLIYASRPGWRVLVTQFMALLWGRHQWSPNRVICVTWRLRELTWAHAYNMCICITHAGHAYVHV